MANKIYFYIIKQDIHRYVPYSLKKHSILKHFYFLTKKLIFQTVYILIFNRIRRIRLLKPIKNNVSDEGVNQRSADMSLKVLETSLHYAEIRASQICHVRCISCTSCTCYACCTSPRYTITESQPYTAQLLQNSWGYHLIKNFSHFFQHSGTRISLVIYYLSWFVT